VADRFSTRGWGSRVYVTGVYYTPSHYLTESSADVDQYDRVPVHVRARRRADAITRGVYYYH